MKNWIISRSRARDGINWHIQVRSDDQLNSFTAVVDDFTNLLKTKVVGGNDDIFVLTAMDMKVVMNVIGKIRYDGDWEGV